MGETKGPCAIMSVLQKQRSQTAPRVQEILTEFGCIIRVRLGLHEVTPEFCSPEGLILLVLCGSEQEMSDLAKRLQALEGVKVQRMSLEE